MRFNINELNSQLHNKSIGEQLRSIAVLFPEKVIFTTSFGIEDQVLSHIIFENNIPIEVVTLDTGRLFPETYQVFNETIRKYQKKIVVMFPEYEAVEKMVSEKGPFSFYLSKENRIECCKLRKVIPLNRALHGKECWISGIRASQSDNRGKMSMVEFDEEKGLYKFYPLFDWTLEEVEKFISQNNIPYNVLHDKGYKSIGCQPCTRAVKEGEDMRAGRWWWETDCDKECGCHVK
jgi:phosphoadenosine phosphosulfate reductase